MSREFVVANPVVAQVMFSRPFAGSSRRSVDRRWHLGVRALFAGLRP